MCCPYITNDMDHHHLYSLPTAGGATAAPPPTPSTQPILSSETTAPDFLSQLLRRLPPTLSFSAPIRRPSPLTSATATATATAENPPLISLSHTSPSPALLSAATQFGYFHLAHHRIPAAAESTAASLFGIPRHRKQLLFPKNFPLGYEAEDDDGAPIETFCLDESTAAEADLDLSSLSREMERLGLEVLDKLACAAGFLKPAQNELCSLMWISDGANKPGRVYPYAVGVHYQIRCQKMSLLSDSGWVNVPGQADSVFVTLGDVAQVWSNGKLKKVAGRPIPSSSGCDNKNSRCITMSLLVTLPMESTVSPLLPNLIANDDDDNIDDREQRLFNSFSFEDYAWTVYHERMHVKDPLDKYRVSYIAQT